MVYDYEWFEKAYYDLTKIELSCYKEKQMRRRIETLMSKKGITTYDGFIEQLKKDHDLFEEFISYLTINVSEFFRNPEQWKYMIESVFPELIDRFGQNLKIWSAACSTGDEPYSLVMALSKLIPIERIKIHATDIDKQIMEKARLGIYDKRSIVSLPADLKAQYFETVGSAYRISETIKKHVQFEQHDLLKDNYGSGYNMIICRNVIIYFTEEAKDEIFKKFYKALAPGGILFIGSTEQIIGYKEIGYERINTFFYRKPQ